MDLRAALQEAAGRRRSISREFFQISRSLIQVLLANEVSLRGLGEPNCLMWCVGDIHGGDPVRDYPILSPGTPQGAKLTAAFTAIATITVLKKKETTLCAKVSRRIRVVITVTSETWAVMPITNA